MLLLLEGKKKHNKRRTRIRKDVVATCLVVLLASVIKDGNAFVHNNNNNNNICCSRQQPKNNNNKIIIDHVSKRRSTNDFRYGVGRGRRSSSSSQQQRHVVRTNMWNRGGDGDNEIEGADRYKSCIPYLLPLMDGNEYARYLCERIPPLGFLDDLLLAPLAGTPLLSFVFFLALNLGTAGNASMPRTLRFNAQQACLIDVTLIVPSLVESVFDGVDVPRAIAEPCCNFVAITIASVVLYCVTQNLRGKKPEEIPYISYYAEMLVGPF